MNVASGAIQDKSGTGTDQYRYVFAFIIGKSLSSFLREIQAHISLSGLAVIKGLDVLYGLGYHYFDIKFLNGILYANEKERVARQEDDLVLRNEGLRRPIKEVTYVSLGVVGCMIVIAWVLYLYYSV